MGAVASGRTEDELDLTGLAGALGFPLEDETVYRQALVHSSYANEHPGAGLASNERLEFLGDAVLQLVVSEYLYKEYASLAEGELTRVRAAVVSSRPLARKAAELGLGRILLLGRGEEASGGRLRPSVLENALEALVGAAFLVGGLERAGRFVLGLLGEEIQAAAAGMRVKDWKTELQELTQQRFGCLPEYATVGESGPDHARVFEAAVVVAGRETGRGRGRSKKEAEQEAARDAFHALQHPEHQD